MRRYLGVLAVVFPSIVEAQTVLADIPPVASLVAQVSEGVTEPGMIAGGITDPHGGTLRPSDARALSEAEVIFWVGPGLTPWLQTALDRLAGDAVIVTLADAPGVVQRPFRMEAVFEAHDDHGHEEHAEDDHGHDDHAEDDHDHDHDHGGHDGLDPHLWLDPANARAWVKVIADTLAEADPDNGAVYAANAETTLTRLETLERNIAARLEGRTPRFVMDHDSLGHFEDRFGVTALAAISDGDAARPGPRRIDAVRRAARDRVAVCLLVEPGQSGRTAVEGVEVRQVDPLGLTFTPGPLLYGEVLGAITETLILCEGGTRE